MTAAYVTAKPKNPLLFFVQCGPILVSVTCYVAAFLIIGDNPNRTAQTVKLVLWFFPVILEILANLVVSLLAGSGDAFVYDAKAFRDRSATVFIIILGGGLDNITQGFHFMVGNLSFGPHRIGVVFCASIVFVSFFTLHFTTIPDPGKPSTHDNPGTDDEGASQRKRDLGLFFFEFFYLAAVVITLQGMASMIQVGVSDLLVRHARLLTSFSAEHWRQYASCIPVFTRKRGIHELYELLNASYSGAL